MSLSSGVEGYAEGEGTRLPLIELGTVRVEADGLVGLDAQVAEVVVGDVRFPEGLQFNGVNPQRIYERAQGQIRRGDWRFAVRGLEPLLDPSNDAFADARSREQVAEVLQQAVLRWAQHERSVSQLEEALRDQLQGQVAEEGRRLLVRWFDEDAQQATQQGATARAIGLWERGVEVSRDAPTQELLREKIQRAWLLRVERAVDQALQDDGWDTAAQLLAEARRRYPQEEALSRQAERIQRERQPRWAREKVREGHAAYGRGDLETAELAYRQAFPACNATYREVVETQLADVTDRLAASYYARFDDFRARGEEERALRALLAAYQYAPGYYEGLVGEYRDRPDFARIAAEGDRQPPVVTISAPQAGGWSDGEVEVLVEDLVLEVSVRIGTQRWTVPTGRSALLRPSLPEGPVELEVVATDPAGHEGRASLRCTIDRTEPRLTVRAPAVGAQVFGEVEVQLRVDDVAPEVEVEVAGRRYRVPTGRDWSQRVALTELGDVRLEITARDPSNLETKHSLNVRNATLAPGLSRLPEGFVITSTEGDFLHERSGVVFRWVPAGEFQMGSNNGGSDEQPVHRVRFREGFFLAKTELTWTQYERFCQATGRQLPDRTENGHRAGANDPVFNVSWEDASAYCEWAGLRLPSEAEWEYACRAGSTTRYSFGDDTNGLGNYAWFGEDRNEDHAHPVAQKRPNAWGLYDMHGNVWEWCQDTYSDSYQGAPNDGTARVDAGASYRVYRGGGWDDVASYCRSADRSWHSPRVRGTNLGFRPVRSYP